MTDNFAFGPKVRVSVSIEGDMKNIYGSYEALPDNIQDVLQFIIHAVIQISPKENNRKLKPIRIGDFEITYSANNYYCINHSNGKPVISFRKEKDGSYTTDYFSLKQLSLTDPILHFAYQDVQNRGRN